MSRATTRAVDETHAEEGERATKGDPALAVVRRLEPALPHLVAARVAEFDEASRTATLEVGRDQVTAALDAALEPAVIQTALARGERVIAQHEGAGWVVLGALRTAATPGVDEGDEFLIKARRVTVIAGHEFAAVTGAASLVVRATGFVETLAQDITTRASGVHKLVGRMLRLN